MFVGFAHAVSFLLVLGQKNKNKYNPKPERASLKPVNAPMSNFLIEAFAVLVSCSVSHCFNFYPSLTLLFVFCVAVLRSHLRTAVMVTGYSFDACNQRGCASV